MTRFPITAWDVWQLDGRTHIMSAFDTDLFKFITKNDNWILFLPKYNDYGLRLYTCSPFPTTAKRYVSARWRVRRCRAHCVFTSIVRPSVRPSVCNVLRQYLWFAHSGVFGSSQRGGAWRTREAQAYDKGLGAEPPAGSKGLAGLPWVWGFPWGFPWVWVWYGYGDCDESPWVLWVICGNFWMDVTFAE